MIGHIKIIKKDLNLLKEAIAKLAKYPGNQHYLERYKIQRVKLEKDCKVFVTGSKDIPSINNEIKKLQRNILIFKEKAKYKEKKKSIVKIKDILDEISVEVHEHIPSEIKISLDLEKKLGKYFEQEIRDLKLVFNRSGTCTAFMLRKILEKCIFHCFVKYNIVKKIEEENSINKFVSLQNMINIASREKIKQIPILNPKTAKKLQGLKFLGDSSAHNFLTNVEMEEILPQMPYIITALKELTNDKLI
jgi:hypothetical protein